MLWMPPGKTAAPLLVHLHSWSATYDKSSEIEVALVAARERNWIFLSPDFRGVNEKPEACASKFAIQDVLDAVADVRSKHKVDAKRIYLLGGSGGGHMALMMAAKAPKLWAAVSSWVPISDLTAWHEFSAAKGARYAPMMEKCCGGAPGPATAAEYKARSPLFLLGAAKGLPIDIQTGIRDGHEGSVPVSHALNAFNALAEANGQAAKKVSAGDIEFMTREAKIPEALAAEKTDEPGRKKAILFRRGAGKARITVFDGAHETDFAVAAGWLAAFTR